MAASGSMAAASSSFVSVGLLVLMNLFASVSLVGVNKLLVVGFSFRHVLLLSGLHFGVGWAALQGASSADLPASARLFERKVPAWRLVLPSAAAGALSIVLMNYSLRTNSLGSYQMLKVAVLPATIALAAVQGTAVSTADVGAAALVSAGTAVATVTDVDLSAAGSAVGLAAVAATAQYQVACGRVQTDFGLSSAQALHALSAPQAVLTLVAALLLETDWTARLAAARGGGAMLRGGALEADGAGAGLPPAIDDLWGHGYSTAEVMLIALTCVCAAFLNYSSIAVIGKINPVAFQFVNQVRRGACRRRARAARRAASARPPACPTPLPRAAQNGAHCHPRLCHFFRERRRHAPGVPLRRPRARHLRRGVVHAPPRGQVGDRRCCQVGRRRARARARARARTRAACRRRTACQRGHGAGGRRHAARVK
jgi:hypothetical protein